MTESEIRREISALKRTMKAQGIPVRSCFNGGHTPESLRANQKLFALKADLEAAKKEKTT